jgi:hypothetical protein
MWIRGRTLSPGAEAFTPEGLKEDGPRRAARLWRTTFAWHARRSSRRQVAPVMVWWTRTAAVGTNSCRGSGGSTHSEANNKADGCGLEDPGAPGASVRM